MTQEEYLKKLLSAEPSETCPVRRTLELLSGKWRTHIIYELCKKPSCRFGELKKAVPRITNTMLTTTLRDLEKLGIVNRKQFNEVPPHVEYSLTDKGKELLPVFFEIAKWGEKNLGTEEQSPAFGTQEIKVPGGSAKEEEKKNDCQNTDR